MSASASKIPFYDAHCHLQDARLRPVRGEIVKTLSELGVRRAVVNGTREEDWAEVLTLADSHSFVLPSLGLHPWYIKHRSPGWSRTLRQLLQSRPCAIGEIGLDRWIADYDSADQEIVFVEQLQMAQALNRPVSIHCLRAWGRMVEILSIEKPASGFLLHSYGGPAELIGKFAELGGYFSFSGYFAHERKEKQREAFCQVPRERLLIETDAPDMLPPEICREFSFENEPKLNHPANLRATYRYAAEMLKTGLDEFALQMEVNFQRLFGLRPPATTPVSVGA